MNPASQRLVRAMQASQTGRNWMFFRPFALTGIVSASDPQNMHLSIFSTPSLFHQCPVANLGRRPEAFRLLPTFLFVPHALAECVFNDNVLVVCNNTGVGAVPYFFYQTAFANCEHGVCSYFKICASFSCPTNFLAQASASSVFPQFW